MSTDKTNQEIDLDSLEQLAKAATPGPWHWDINPASKSVNLIGARTVYVLSPRRWGPQGATLWMQEPDQEQGGCLWGPIQEGAVPHPGRAHHKDWALAPNRPDASFIAAANPSVVLELIAKLRALSAPTQVGVAADKHRQMIIDSANALSNALDTVGPATQNTAFCDDVWRVWRRLADYLLEDDSAAASPVVEGGGAPADGGSVLVWPTEPNEALLYVLGRPNFWCAGYARMFRQAGHAIAEKAEAEQAFILHWLTGLVLKHGDKWSEVAQQELRALAPLPTADATTDSQKGKEVGND